MVTWTFEENPEGLWAVFVSVGGVSTRCSHWYPTVEELSEVFADTLTRGCAATDLRKRTQAGKLPGDGTLLYKTPPAEAPPTEHRSGDITPADEPPVPPTGEPSDG